MSEASYQAMYEALPRDECGQHVEIDSPAGYIEGHIVSGDLDSYLIVEDIDGDRYRVPGWLYASEMDGDTLVLYA